MLLRKLALENYRCFERLDVEFDDHLNLIIGWNGTGKSSLLLAIRGVLHVMVRHLGGFEAEPLLEDDVRFEMQAIGTRVRFQRRYPVRLRAKMDFVGEGWNFQCQKLASTSSPDVDISFERSQKLSKLAAQFESEPSKILPFACFYSPKRTTTAATASLSDAASQKISRRDGYKGWRDGLISAAELQNWVVGKTLERLQIIAEEGPESPLLIDDELQIVNNTLKDLFWGMTGLRFDLRLRMLMVEFGDGRLLPFMSLSDGQRGFVTLIADICRRILIMNPHLGSSAPQETPGVLMVDELDIHLHPAWQREVIRAIRDRFPKLQVFATCHSPQMIGGQQPNQVFLLHEGRASHPEVSFGLDSSRVLEEIMNSSSQEEEVRVQLNGIFRAIDAGEFDEARQRLAQLRAKAPSLPEYARAEALMRRLETLGR